MSDADLEAFLSSLSRLRDLAIFLLMLDGGLRPGEVLTLQVDDISYGRRRVVIRKRDDHPRGVRGKSRTERVVDLHEPRTLEAVSRYMMHERPLDATTPFVFLVGGHGKRRLEVYGTLRIGAVTLAFAETMPRIIARFRASRPGVRLNVEEIDTPKGRDGLLNHEIDVAIIRLGEPVRHLRTRPLRRDKLVIATPSDYPRVPDSTDAIDLSTLRDEPWVWLRRDVSPDYHDQLLTACREAGFTPDAHCHANSITTQLAMVASGLGITLVPNAAIRFGQPDIRHRPLLNPFELVELSLVSRDTTREPLVNHFIECATTEPR